MIVLAAVALLLSLLSVMRHPRFAAASSRPTPSDVQVKIDNFSFAPDTLTVKVGTRVTWINRDDVPHTVVSDDQAFKSRPLDTDEVFTFTPTKPGTYSYFCSLHPKMIAKFVVE
jgi:plastocyanin